MCGIVGLVSSNAEDAIEGMARVLKHRGPNDRGLWVDPGIGIALAHTRLSIVDLSQAGHQPMVSSCGRFVMVFNGEIYNHHDLRSQLDKLGGLGAFTDTAKWRGHSDSETLLACFATWGIESTLNAAVGMFALALWDRELRMLYLMRDRMGEKPLYYGWIGSSFAFASELKAIRAHPSFGNRINRTALTSYMQRGVVPAPHSIYENIFKLPPASFATISIGDIQTKRIAEPQPYWSFADVASRGASANSQFTSPEEAVDALDRELRASVRLQMIADVPLGAFLSGGIDSSSIVALMQAQSRIPIRTFSIGFHEARYDEAEQARSVAKHLGTDHTELYVSEDEAQAVIHQLPEIYCEPFADCSQIPTLLVAQLARSHVSVSLSGDGGDELFGGYNRHVLAAALWPRLVMLPRSLRLLCARVIRGLSPNLWDSLYGAVAPLLPDRLQVRMAGEKLHKGAEVLEVMNPMDLYRRLTTQWDVAGLVLDSNELAMSTLAIPQGLDSIVEQMMAMDTLTFLPDDILVKVDRAGMAVSLETRMPFLDHRLIEFAWRLPLSLKIQGGKGKWILRQLLSRYLPEKLIARPKMGFAVPLDAWLRGPLRPWAESLLDERQIARHGYLNPKPIRQRWAEHLSGRRNWEHQLWTVLMFQSWIARWQT